MKRISRSLLSLCLALLLCAAAVPNVNVAKAATGKDSSDSKVTGSSDPFMITGYDVRPSTIETGDIVDVNVYLYRTDGQTSDITIIRGLDSFQGDSTTYASVSKETDNKTYIVHLNGLTYAGDGKSLVFSIYYTDTNGSGGGYQDESLTIRECVPYTEPKEEDAEVIPAPRAVFSSDGMASAISAGETRYVTIYVENAGTTAMRDPILSVKSSGSLMLLDGQSDYVLDDIRAGRGTQVTVTVKAPDKIESQMQTLDASLSFYYDNGTSLTGGSASGSVSVLSNVSKDTQSSDVASPTPVVILTKYNYGGSSIAAGSSANLSFTFTNTSKTLAIENVMVTVNGGTDLMLNGSTNTFYFDSVAAGGGKSVTVPMKAAQIISSAAQPVTISVSYEYVDQGARKTGSANLTLNVPLYQPDRFELSDPTSAYVGTVGEETSLTMSYVNKGKSAVSNVEATISGDVDSSTAYQRIGTIEGGKNGTIAFAVTPYNEGENAVKITITYEDSNGNVKERVFETSVEAMAYEPIDPVDPDEPIDPEPTSTFPWKYVIIALVIAAIVVLIVLRARKKKAKQKAEQEMWDKWDEEEAAKETSPAESEAGVGAGAEEQVK